MSTNVNKSTNSHEAAELAAKSAWSGKRVLFWLVAFFGVIIMVNMGLLYYALTSWPGLAS